MAVIFISRSIIKVLQSNSEEEITTSLSEEQIMALQAFCVIGREQGNKIATIKAIRSILGCGLRFAKNFMEQSLPVEMTYRNGKTEAWHVLAAPDRD